MVAGWGSSRKYREIGVLVINDVPKRRVMLCAECEDEECIMAEKYLDEHDVPFKLKIVDGFKFPIILTERGDCFELYHAKFGEEELKERMDELRLYCYVA